MVAIIKPGYSIRRTFHYNENKVNDGVASLLMAQNYPMDADRMNSEQRIAMLLKTAEKAPKVNCNSIHISLNFAPGEVIDSDRMKNIATEYMEAIGFGNQPFLVYQHFDAGHPHLHIVTTVVQPNGKALRIRKIGRDLSEKARKDIETKYGLVRAEDHKRGIFKLQPVNIEKIIYGKTDTRRAISNILSHVLTAYKYTSLTELNAVLNGYNIAVERISDDHKGLYYRLINEQGKPVGVPLKASLFHQRPTLSYLQKRFLINHAARKPHAQRVMNAVGLIFLGKRSVDLERLKKQLLKSGIKLIPRVNKEGRLYGVTYVDFTTKCVFNGSDLGKDYSANAINERLEKTQPETRSPTVEQLPIGNPQEPLASSQDLLELLMQSEQGCEFVPYHLRPKRKKKKK